ncbi:MAG TPA: F0F1 ATP synthase subunit delta [Terriglobales bacterium]|jgi:F-type H+-transporting ATPase subunit delta|nr:F0F1 ATP synthase subunit delta [Terriglobales bacterium]
MKSTKQLEREAKQLFRVCLVGGSLDEARVREAVQKVLDAKRRGSLTLLSRFQHLVKLERARHTAEVESVTSLPDELRANVLSNLDRLYGPGLSTSFALNPSLIGGMRIRVGSDVYDGSVRAELASLQKSF